MLQSLFSAGSRVATAALAAVLPPRCLSCGVQISDAGSFCGDCWSGLQFISAPQCQRCGLPLGHGGEGLTCAACLARPPAFSTARSVWTHSDAARETVLAFKYTDRPQLARSLARQLVRIGQPVLDQPQALIVPVPLHRWRLLARRYNQAAELARALGRLSGKPVATRLLRRVRATRPQQGLSAAARIDNVRRAFALAPGAGRSIAGRPVILVDDVFTTGATLEACTRALLKGGALRVDVLTLTRVVIVA